MHNNHINAASDNSSCYSDIHDGNEYDKLFIQSLYDSCNVCVCVHVRADVTLAETRV